MPAFDLRFVSKPEDIPGCLVSVDASQRNLGDVTVDGGGVVRSLKNKAATSLRARNGGDRYISPWWDANEETSGPTPSVSAGSFGGIGGVSVPAGADFILTQQQNFALISAGEYSFFFVVDYTPGTPAIVFEDGAAIIVAADNGFGNLAYTDGGAGATGPAGIAGPQYHVLRLGKATPLASPTGDWRRNGASIFSGAYAPANFGGPGTNTRIFGGPIDFGGVAGRMLAFTRRLVDVEVEFLESTAPQLFGLTSGAARTYVAPTDEIWSDPPSGGSTSRLNSVSGIPERYYRVKRVAGQPVSVLLEAVIGDALDTSTDFVAYYVEWPLQGTTTEPPIYQDPNLPGVCRLDFGLDGHYLVGLRRPGGGAILVHLDVASF